MRLHHFNQKKNRQRRGKVEELDDFGEYHFRSIHETEIHMLLGQTKLGVTSMDHYEETLRNL